MPESGIWRSPWSAEKILYCSKGIDGSRPHSRIWRSAGSGGLERRKLVQNQETYSVLASQSQRLKSPLEGLQPGVDRLTLREARRRGHPTHAGGWSARKCHPGATSVAALGSALRLQPVGGRHASALQGRPRSRH